MPIWAHFTGEGPKLKMPDKRNYTFHPGREFQLSWDDLNDMYTDGDENACYLVALDGRSIAYLQAMTSVFPLYHWLWGLPSPRSRWDQATTDKWDEIQNFVAEVNECLMSGCNVSDLVTAIETQTEAINTLTSKFDHQGIGLAEIISNWSDRTDVNLGDLIDEIEAQTTLADDVQDLLFFLKLFRDLLPNFSIPLPDVIAIWQVMLEMRYRHNDLTIKGYQATSLRHIGNALAPVVENGNGTEESIVKGIIQEIERVPWLTAAVVSIFDPSPSGEIALVTKIGLTAKNLYDKAVSMWASFRDAYINKVENPQPQATVTGMLNEIAARLADVGGNIGVNVQVLSDCDDCGPEGGSQTATGDMPAELVYLCNASRWYTGIVIDKLLSVVNGALEAARPTLTESEWNKIWDYTLANMKDEPDTPFFSAIAQLFVELAVEITEEEQAEVIDVTTVFVNDWGNEMSWPSDDRSRVYDLLTEGVIYPGEGPSGSDKILPLDVLRFISVWIDNQQAIIDAIYQGTSASNARDNLTALFDNIYPSNVDGTINYGAPRQAMARILSHQNILNKIFSMDVSQSEIDRYAPRVLATCTDLVFNDCPGRTYYNTYGTPNYATEADFMADAYNYSIESEWDSVLYKVVFSLTFDCGIRVNSISGDGPVEVSASRCDGTIVACQEFYPGDLPLEFAGGLWDFDADYQFTIDFDLISYNVSDEQTCS